MNRRSLATNLAAAALLLAAGCAGPGERASNLATEVNPLQRARVGDSCRYRSVREGVSGEPVIESWTMRVVSSSRGTARVDVTVLGPARVPQGPSPREPGFSLRMPTANAGLSALEILRLFRHPELTTEGMSTVLDRDVEHIEGSTRSFPLLILDRTRDATELTVTTKERSGISATYRVVVSGELPVLGISEAELDEVWTSVSEDGQLHTERRHERLELVDMHDVTEAH